MADQLPRRIVARRRLPLGAMAWLAVGLVTVACAAALPQRDLAWLSVAPLSLALFVWYFREPRFELQLDASTLAVNAGPPVTYESITRVRPLGDPTTTPATFPIVVRHAGGEFIIPHRLDVPSQELLAWLRAKAPPYVLQINPRLNEFLAAQESLYGDRMAIYVGETRAPERKYWRPVQAFLAAALVTAVAGIAAYASGLATDHVLVLGLVALVSFVVTGLFALLNLSRSQTYDAQPAGLIITPAGMAMIQGDLAGELRWEEIRSAKLSRGAVAVGPKQQVRGACIHLAVAGATIQIADIYHEPVSHIYASIQRLRSV
jgi:hypothetical protein